MQKTTKKELTNLIELFLQLDDLFRLDLDVCGLSLSPSRRLVNHDACVRQGVSHSVLACRLRETKGQLLLLDCSMREEWTGCIGQFEIMFC